MTRWTILPPHARAATATLAVVVAITSACSPPRDSGAAASGSPSSVRAADGATSTPAVPDGQGVPAMLFADPTGLAMSGRDRPLDRTSLGLPPGRWQATAAVGMPPGAILLVSSADRVPATAVVGQLVGARVEPRWVVMLSAALGRAVLPGCVSGDGRAVVIADGLVYLDTGPVAGMLDMPGTIGRCQMLDDGAVAFLAEGDHAVSIWRPAVGSVVVTDTRCDDFAVAGGEMACLDAAGEVAIGPLVPPTQGGPAFAKGGAAPIAAPARQVLLSKAGDLLAVVGRDGPVIEFYRLTGGRVVPAGGSSLPSGEALLGFLSP